MAHRRNQSSRSFPMPSPSSSLSQAVSASGVGIAAVVSAAAAALAPVASSLPGAVPRSASSLDVADFLVPPTPGTPSKFDRRSPMHVAPSSILASPRALLRRFTAVLSPQRTHAQSLPLKSPFLRSSTPVPSLPIPLRRRATFLALIVLLSLSAWTVLTTSLAEHDSGGWADWHKRTPGLDSAERHRLLSSASFRGATILPGANNAPSHAKANLHVNAKGPERSPLALTPRDELAALTAFMAALPWNALPAHVDAHAPLDPELILDFDVRRDRDRALMQLAELRRDTWALNPVVIFGKSRHAPTRELRALLDSMYLTPAPTVFEINTRVDEHIMTPLLARLTSPSEPSSTTEFPILLIGGEPVDISDSLQPEERGGPLRERDTVKALLEGGELRRRVVAAGAVPSEKKRKGKGRRSGGDVN